MKRKLLRTPIYIAFMALVVLVLLIGYITYTKNNNAHGKNEGAIKEAICEEYLNKNSLLDFSTYVKNDINISGKIIQKKLTVSKLVKSSYDSALLGMWNINNWDEEWFKHYLGIDTIFIKERIDTLYQMDYYLKRFEEYRQDVNCLFIYVDPYQLFQEYLRDTEMSSDIDYDEALRSYFLDYMNALPNTWFHLIFPAYPVSYWQDLGYEKTDEVLNCWSNFLMYLHWYANVDVIWLGSQEWITINNTNYSGNIAFSDEFAEKAFLQVATFKYLVDVASFEDSRIELQRVIESNSSDSVKDLSNLDVIFIGDSVFDYTKQSTSSIPGVVAALSGARTYNISVGGTTASYSIDSEYSPYSFVPITELFLYKASSGGLDRSESEFERYLTDDHSAKNLFFVIAYGFNDYFSYKSVENLDDEYDISTYKGALQTGIENIMRYNDKINIVLVTPYDVLKFNEHGEESRPISPYVRAMEDVASNYSAVCLNMDEYFKSCGLEEKAYLADGLHLSNDGNVIFAKLLIEELAR